MTSTKVLKKYKKIAIVGISLKPHRASYKVAVYLKEQGYDVVGVRPGCDEIDGIKVYPTLADVPGGLEIVNVFRALEHIPAVTTSAIKADAKVLWLQLDLAHPESEERARTAGLEVVSDLCTKIEHAQL